MLSSDGCPNVVPRDKTLLLDIPSYQLYTDGKW